MIRMKRSNVRGELESVLGSNSNKYKRIVERIEQLVSKRRARIKKKNKKKIDTYKEKQEKLNVEKRISSLLEVTKPYYDLRAIRGFPIDPDTPKPPRIDGSTTQSLMGMGGVGWVQPIM